MSDPDLLPDLSIDELRALAGAMLAPAQQSRLDALLMAQAGDTLQADEAGELDDLIEQIDRLNLIKARAIYTLKQGDGA